MVTIDSFRKLAMSFPGAVEMPHFDRTSFRFKKKIFVTLDENENLACLMLSPEDQAFLCTVDTSIIYPVPNKWGLKGATYADLKKVTAALLKEGLKLAYKKVSGQ
jgi:hypothetical protein